MCQRGEEVGSLSSFSSPTSCWSRSGSTSSRTAIANFITRLQFFIFSWKLKKTFFSKLSVHDGEEEEGGCPLPDWKPCGCREKARRRQVCSFSYISFPYSLSLLLYVFFFHSHTFHFIPDLSLSHVSLLPPFLLSSSHLFCVGAGRRQCTIG